MVKRLSSKQETQFDPDISHNGQVANIGSGISLQNYLNNSSILFLSSRLSYSSMVEHRSDTSKVVGSSPAKATQLYSSMVERRSHTPNVIGSSPIKATRGGEAQADVQ